MNLVPTISTVLCSPIALLIAAIIILIHLLIWYNSRKNDAYWANKNIPIGRTQSMLKLLLRKDKIEDAELEAVRKNGKIFGTYQSGKPTIFCADPDLIGNVLSKDFTTFPNRRVIKFNNHIMDNFMNLVADEKWKRIRAIVSPTFSSGKLRKMRPIIDDCVATLIGDFNRSIVDNNVINVKNVFGAFTMNVITQVAFGTKVGALIDEDNPIIVNANKLFKRDFKLWSIMKFLIQSRFPKVAKVLGINFIPIEVMEFFYDLTLKIIDERRSDKSNKKRHDFLQLLLDSMDNNEEQVDENQHKKVENDGIIEDQILITHNKSMSIAEITSQCVLFFVAGYETTATTIAYSVYNLACNPDSQKILYEEAKSVIESHTEVEYDLIHSLKYTDAVISETLRMFSPAPSLERVAAEDYILGDRIKISKGDIVHIPVNALHKNDEYFPEPELFKPERFLLENRAHHPYAYLPFGAGPRNCVARRLALLEAKLAVLFTIYNFRFNVTEKTEHPPKTYNTGGPRVPREILLKVEKR